MHTMCIIYHGMVQILSRYPPLWDYLVTDSLPNLDIKQMGIIGYGTEADNVKAVWKL